MRAAAFLQARLGSKRLPGKVLLPLGSEPLLKVLMNRVSECPQIVGVVVSTSTSSEDDALEKFCLDQGVPCSRFAVDDILGRLNASLAQTDNVDYLVRCWGDSPFVCPEMITEALLKMELEGADFLTTGYPRLSFPAGLDFEIYRTGLIRNMAEATSDPFFREFPYEYIKAHSEIKRTGIEFSEDLSSYELSVDYEQDLEVARKLFHDLGGETRVFPFADIREYLRSNSELFDRNSGLARNIEYKQKLEQMKK